MPEEAVLQEPGEGADESSDVLRMAAVVSLVSCACAWSSQVALLVTSPWEKTWHLYASGLAAPDFWRNTALVSTWFYTNLAERAWIGLGAAGAACGAYGMWLLGSVGQPSSRPPLTILLRWGPGLVMVMSVLVHTLSYFPTLASAVRIHPGTASAMVATGYLLDPLLLILLAVHLRQALIGHVHDRLFWQMVDPLLWVSVLWLVAEVTQLFAEDSQDNWKIHMATNWVAAISGVSFALVMAGLWRGTSPRTTRGFSVLERPGKNARGGNE